ncbi:MAG TPA: NuoM family protein [Candidatus Gastranaerophilales bacterium]|nr:NuoM family protein [Candidatus Gastranaerophilales bacterium]
MSFLSLTLLIFLPLAGALIIYGPWFPQNEVKIRRFAKGFAGFIFVYSLLFLAFFNPTEKGFQFTETLTFPDGSPWIEPLGVNFSLAVDGISIILVVLTTFLVLLGLIASKFSITKRHKFYYSMIFVLQTAILGVFTAKDLFLFILFWEIELIPMYFLISVWGTGKKEYSAMKFVLYTFTGSIFMLASILAVVYYNYIQTGIWTFDLNTYTYMKAFTYPTLFGILTFLGFFIAFAVKLPVVPFHTWLPDAHVDAPTPVSMLLAGMLLKMGGYGMIRMNLQMMPEILKILSPLIVIFAVINIIYAALIAIAQKDLKKLVAYSSVSHMGIVLLGIGAMNIAGVSGAVFQMVAHGIISAGLFMIVGVIYLRTHTREIAELGGLGQNAPKIMYFSMIIALASLGLPLLIGFAAETLTFYGAFTSNVFNGFYILNQYIPLSIRLLTAIAIIGIIFAAIYILWMFHRVFWGNMFDKWEKFHDASPHEMVVLISLIFVIVVFGVYPAGLINIFAPTISSFMNLI